MSGSNYKPVGGVESCALYPTDAVEMAIFSSEGCTLRLSGTPIAVVLLDDASLYEENFSFEQGAATVAHRLHLAADRLEAKEWLDETFLERAAFEGFIALLSLNDGRRLLSGYSAHLGAEQPLRLEKITSTSGNTLRERPSVVLQLIAHDADFSTEILEMV